MDNHSLWLSGQNLYQNHLKEDVNSGVCIVGGGLTGIYTAYLLAKAGVKVIVLEAKEQLGDNATSHSTGKLSVQHHTIYQKLTADQAKLHYEINYNAIKFR